MTIASGEQLLKWASQFTLEHLKSAGIRAEGRANKRKERLASHYVKRANKRCTAGEADKEYLIESILGQRGDADELEYLVRWDGYDSDWDTYEPEAEMYADGEPVDALERYLLWEHEM